MQNTCLLICHFKTVDSMTIAGSNMRFWDPGVFHFAADWAGQGLGEDQCILAELRGGPRDLWSCTDILQLQFPAGKSNTQSSLSVKGAINVTHPQSPLSHCLYNFVVLHHVIQWLIDWCLHLRCKSSEKSILFRFLGFFALHSVIFDFCVQILTKISARKKDIANHWHESHTSNV